MGYQHIENLYRCQDILIFKECFALEKIHGTSAHISWNGDRLNFSSGAASSEAFKGLFDIPLLTAKFKELVEQPATVYGEAYGGKLLNMSENYGKNLRFIVFDIKINDVWLSVPQAHSLAESLSLEFVHYARIPATLEAIDEQTILPSVQSVRNGIQGDKIREGIVLRPIIELRKNNDERIMAKHKRDEFRETQKVRVVDPAKMIVLHEAQEVADEWVVPMRLQHVLDKIDYGPDNPLTPRRTYEIVAAMTEDVLREGKGEFVDSPEVRKAIGRRAAALYNQHIKSANLS